ncbi:hypothetical protein, partial [Pandoraea sputorum]|uniref:hypothetical protein n=1 Tax=Pandoraea sputorum TaxID=93222 RepID=UPI001241D625
MKFSKSLPFNVIVAASLQVFSFGVYAQSHNGEAGKKATPRAFGYERDVPTALRSQQPSRRMQEAANRHRMLDQRRALEHAPDATNKVDADRQAMAEVIGLNSEIVDLNSTNI